MLESLSKLYWKIKVLLKGSSAQLAWKGVFSAFFKKRKEVTWFWKKVPYLCAFISQILIQNAVLRVS